jgi:hypothetical protein
MDDLRSPAVNSTLTTVRWGDVARGEEKTRLTQEGKPVARLREPGPGLCNGPGAAKGLPA